MLAIIVSFQPSLSFGDDSESTFQIVPFSSLVEEKKTDGGKILEWIWIKIVCMIC